MDDTERNDERQTERAIFILKKKKKKIEPKFTEKKIQLCKVLIWEAVLLHFAMMIVYYLSKYINLRLKMASFIYHIHTLSANNDAFAPFT